MNTANQVRPEYGVDAESEEMCFGMSTNVQNKSYATSRSNVFITPKIWYYVACGFEFGSKFAGHPFRWNRSQNQVQAGGMKQQLFWRLNMLVAFAYAFFVYFRTMQTAMNLEKTNAEKIYMRVMAAYMSLSLVLHVGIIQNQKLIPMYNNQYYQLALLLERKYLKKHAKQSLLLRFTGWTLQAMYSSINCITILMAMNAFLRPMSSEQLTSLWTEKPTIVIRIAAACIMGYIEYIFHASTFVTILSCFPPISFFLSVLNELSCTTSQLTKDSLRRYSKVKFQLYQHLRIETQYVNIITMEVATTGFKILGLVLVVYGVFGGITMQGIESFALGFLGTIMAMILLVLFSFLAEFHFRSNKLLMEWRAELDWDVNRKWATRYVKSLTPMKIMVRSFYYVDRSIVLTLAGILVVNTTNVLLVNR